jgi:hypothetical protein
VGGNKGMIRLRRPVCGLRHYLGTEQSSEEVGGGRTTEQNPFRTVWEFDASPTKC